jgi:ketosteroid isomerase-like protein
MLMPPKEAPVEGKKAILAWLSMYFDRHTSQPESAEIEKIEASGDLAFVHYHVIGSYTARATGKSIPYDQKCLDVLRRQPDGSWKVALHMWSSNNYLPSVWDKDWKKGEAAE